MPNSSAKPVSNIITRRYKHGSIIYFEGEKSNFIYILKSGRVILTSIKIDSGEEVKEEVRKGEFFGVKSAIGKYPREETAQTIGETQLLVLTMADFERLLLKNVGLVIKMLRIFSNQLRRVGKMQREVLGEIDSVNPAEELFKIGEYYNKAGKVEQALYSYKRHMEHYPGTKFSDVALSKIKAIQMGQVDLDVQSNSDLQEDLSLTMEKDEDIDFSDFSIDDGMDSGEEIKGENRSENDSSQTSSLDEGGDDFLLQSGDDIDFTFDEPIIDVSEEVVMDITEMYYNAMNLFSQKKYADAISEYEKILEVSSFKNSSEKKIFEKSFLELGKCFLRISKYNDALKTFSTLTKKFPESESFKKALFYIGIVYETAKKNDKAIPYFKKVASLDPSSELGKKALVRLKSLKK